MGCDVAVYTSSLDVLLLISDTVIMNKYETIKATSLLVLPASSISKL